MVTEVRRGLLSVVNEYGIHKNTPGKWKRLYVINPEGVFNGGNRCWLRSAHWSGR